MLSVSILILNMYIFFVWFLYALLFEANEAVFMMFSLWFAHVNYFKYLLKQRDTPIKSPTGSRRQSQTTVF